MAMREANIYMSPCEVIRHINDLCQSDSEKDVQIRKLCYKVLKQAKGMSDEVHKHLPKYSHSWGETNPNWKGKFAIRIEKGYKVDK